MRTIVKNVCAMKLSNTDKVNLLSSANEVYLGYTALDFFKSKSFNTASGQSTLYDLCQQAIANRQYDQTLLINNVNYRLVLIPGENNTFKVQFARSIGSTPKSLVKKIAEYSDPEALNLISNQELTLDASVGEKPSVANRINKDCIIGGPGKVDLYRTHLVTLHNIIEKIDSEEDISNLLVALATGSGKTFVQALWMLILSLSKNNGVFAVPDKLATQFAKDLKRLLPDDFVNQIMILRDKHDNPQALEAIKAMSQTTGTGAIVIGSAERLLDRHYQDLMDANSEKTFLSFDEQHLIMKAERRRIRLIELSKQKLSMFLTATPNEETYNLSGNKPVAIMSSGQKQEAGQGQFPSLYTHQARNVTDRNSLRDFKFWTSEFWSNMLNGLLLRITNSIQEEQSSAAVTLVDDLPFYIHRKKGEVSPRWSMQVPAARKMLFIIDDNETLVNFCHSLDNAYSRRRDVYRNGNVINRADVSDFFGYPDAEVEVISNDMNYKRMDYLDSLPYSERQLGSRLATRTLKKNMENTIFHNLIEYVLTDITGLDEIEHNRLRKENLNNFQKLVTDKFVPRTAAYYQQKLAKDIDQKGAEDLSVMLSAISSEFQSMINGHFSRSRQENDIDLQAFIDNWYLSDDIITKLTAKNYNLSTQFTNYARSHAMIGIMSGMKDSETPVDESRPFTGLTEHQYGIYDGNGLLVNNAKKRKHTSLEILNDTSRESSFTPAYLNITEEIADNYFRLGFVGAYVSNKKTEGFSDRNLHTVVNISEERLSPTNSPDTQIQGIGRNRGLDETIEPAYIHSLGRNQKSVFDLNHLQSNDYYPALFKSQNQFNKEYIEVLGTTVSQKIIGWIYANMEKDDTLNPDRLKRQVMKFIAEALRDLNNKNSHQIKLSRSQLTSVVSYAMKGINKEIDHLQNPYKISLFITILGYVLNFIFECYYTVKRIIPAVQMYFFSWFGTRTAEQSDASPKHADDVYIKILSNTSFKDIIANMSSVLELRNWLTRKADGIQPHITKNIDAFLKKDVLDALKIHQKEFLEPLLIKLVVNSQKAKVAAALASFPDLFALLKANLTINLEADDQQMKATILGVLKQIPGLEHLAIADIINYPKDMEALQTLLSNTPEQLLLNDLELQSDLSASFGDYLKGDFTKHLSSFLTFPNVKKVEQVLAKEDNAKQFIQHCLTKALKKELSFSPEMIFTELNTYFKIEGCTTLDKESDSLLFKFNELNTQTSAHPIQSLNDEHISKLSTLLEQMLPVLVNLYPLEARGKLLAEASVVKLKELLKNHGDELISLKDNHQVLADFIFKKLSSAPVPAQINIPQEVNHAKEFFKTSLEAIMKTSATDLVVGKFFSPSSWSFTKEYLYDTPIAALLSSDKFLNSISIMLPYNQWLELKRKVNQNYPGMIAISRVLIDKAVAGQLSDIDPEELLTLFNKHLNTNFVGSEQTALTVAQSVQEFTAEVTAKTLNALNPEVQSKYAELISEQLLPLLASFINDDLKKEQFLAVKHDDKTLIEFITKNSEALNSLGSQSDDALKQVLVLINQLVPATAPLVLEDIIDIQNKAVGTSSTVLAEIKKIALITFINSSLFFTLMKDFLNHQDFKLLMTHLSSSKNQSLLADQMIALNVDSLDKESILNIIKSSDPSLESITTMDDRFNSLKELLNKHAKNPEGILDNRKVFRFMADEIAPILFHQKLSDVLDEIIGYLDVNDLTVLFKAMNKPAPAAEAKEFLKFIKVIKRRDVGTLVREFLTAPDQNNPFDIDKLPIKKMLDDVRDLIEEVLDCHCYYNDQDRKGSAGRGTNPKILSKLSNNLSGIQITSSYSFFSHFSRKLFYIKGIQSGIEAGGEISADSNSHFVKQLERVNTHILRPMWWGTNASNFGHAFIKFGRNIVHGIVDGYFAVLNGFKSLLNALGGYGFIISTKNPDSVDYNDTAFDFAHEINDLDPLNAEQVKEEKCHPDVVIKLEEFVNKRNTRPGFFRDAREAVETEAQIARVTP